MTYEVVRLDDPLSIRDGIPEKTPESDEVFEMYRGATYIGDIVIFM